MARERKKARGRPAKDWVHWHITAPWETKERIRQRAKARGVPMTVVVVEALEALLARP